MHTITGKELDKAILKSQGRSWDSMPIMKLSVDDLKQNELRIFKERAVKRGCLTDDEVNISNMILKNMFLRVEYLKRGGDGRTKSGKLARNIIARYLNMGLMSKELWCIVRSIRDIKNFCMKNDPVQNEQDREQDLIDAIIKFCSVSRFSNEIIVHLNLLNRSYFKCNFLDKMLWKGILKMTIPDKFSSKKQKYFS